MRSVFLIVLIFLCALVSRAQNYVWAKQVGVKDTYDYGWDIATDQSGNVYITGVFQGSPDFDPGPDTAILPGTSGGAYFAKYDACGNYIWAKYIPSAHGTAVCIDHNNDVLITGTFTATADFDPGVNTVNLTPVGSYDFYFAKYDSNGNYIWAKSIGGSGVDQSYDIGVDLNNNIYLTGYSTGTVDFNPGSGVANRTASSMGDIFVAKYDGNGNFSWAFNILCSDLTGYHYGFGLAVDKNSNVYVTGSYRATADFDPGPGQAIRGTTTGLDEYFCAKYDASGNFVWANSIEGAGGTWNGDAGHGICVDSAGSVYVTGWFNYMADFDPGPNTAIQTADGGGIEVFFMKYDTDGKYLWAKRIAGTADAVGRNIEVGPSGNIYVSGKFKGKGDFNPGTGLDTISTTAGWHDIFLAKYDPNGDFISAGKIGGEGFLEECFGMSVDDKENVYITGGFSYTCDFDFSADSAIFTANASVGYPYTTDLYFAKYSNPSIPYITSSGNSCQGDSVRLTASADFDSYLWSYNGDTTQSIYVSQSGTYSVILYDAAGCFQKASIEIVLDSSITLTASPSSTTICEGGSVILEANGTLSYEWSPALGLSSTTGSSVTANPVTTTSYKVVGRSGGCVDSAVLVVTVNPLPVSGVVAANPDSVCSGETAQLNVSGSEGSIQWQSSTDGILFSDLNGDTVGNYTTPGLTQNIYYRILASNTCGLDSTPAIKITSLPLPNPLLTAIDSLICSGDSTEVCVSGNYAFTWNNGDVRNCIYAKAAGAYWVTASDANGCSAISDRAELSIHPIPPVSIVIQGDTLSSFNAVSYQWYFNGQLIHGATDAVYVAQQSGDYSLEIVDDNGCRANSNPVNVILSGIPDIYGGAEISISPNPFNNLVQIHVFYRDVVIEEVWVYDVVGRIISFNQYENHTGEVVVINFEGNYRGIYFIKVVTGERDYLFKVVKQ